MHLLEHLPSSACAVLITVVRIERSIYICIMRENNTINYMHCAVKSEWIKKLMNVKLRPLLPLPHPKCIYQRKIICILKFQQPKLLE